MYAYIEGTVAEKLQNEVVIDAGGVGYLINCSTTTIASIPALGQSTRIYTWLSVKEDAMELFGFSSIEEKRMFLRLTSISGIGPRSALGVMGSMPLRDLTLAIVTGDTAALCRAPGIGKKTAQRIALELKETVSEGDLAFSPEAAAASQAALNATDAVAEAIEALKVLGYTPTEATNAISKVQHQSDKVDELIRLALRNMAGM